MKPWYKKFKVWLVIISSVLSVVQVFWPPLPVEQIMAALGVLAAGHIATDIAYATGAAKVEAAKLGKPDAS